MKQVRQVIRVGNAYYVSIPKPIIGALKLFRGSFVVVKMQGGRVVMEPAKAGLQNPFGGEE